ncbi:MAG: YiiX/YebB-like N1pC/P60 family cysteine hydrolase [archaeon]
MRLSKAKKALIIIFVLALVIFMNSRCASYKITHTYIEQIRPELMPGDIVVERTEWRLSNFLYPGFWKHSFIYTGTLSEMDGYFNGSKVINGSVSAYLRENMPEVYEKYTKSYGDYEANMIESKHFHVRIGPIEDYAQSDYIGVMRPKLSKDAKLRAVLKALSFSGKFYDLLFDYSDNSTIACSEVVYFPYSKNYSEGGLDLKLAKVLWTEALLPNDLVRKYELEIGEEGELDFVLFIDSDKENLTRVDDKIAFMKSWQRESITMVYASCYK